MINKLLLIYRVRLYFGGGGARIISFEIRKTTLQFLFGTISDTITVPSSWFFLASETSELNGATEIA